MTSFIPSLPLLCRNNFLSTFLSATELQANAAVMMYTHALDVPPSDLDRLTAILHDIFRCFSQSPGEVNDRIRMRIRSENACDYFSSKTFVIELTFQKVRERL